MEENIENTWEELPKLPGPDSQMDRSKEREKHCFLCEKTSSLKSFNASTLSKAKLSLKKRIHFDLRYQDVELPVNCDDTSIGYCSKPCYSTFISLKACYDLPE